MRKIQSLFQLRLNPFKVSSMGAAVFATLALSACGQAPVGSVAGVANVPGYSAYPGACQTGSYMVGATCTPINNSVSLSQTCSYQGGQIATGADGIQVCKVNLNFGSRIYAASNGIPRITPSTASAMGLGYLGIEVYPGDRVNYRGTGGWSETGGSLFFPTSSRCHDKTNTGWNGSTIVQNEGIAAGLVASDGTTVYLLGENGAVSIVNRGSLRLGFNAPSVSSGCFQLDVNYLSVDRCTDASGNIHTCQ